MLRAEAGRDGDRRVFLFQSKQVCLFSKGVSRVRRGERQYRERFQPFTKYMQDKLGTTRAAGLTLPAEKSCIYLTHLVGVGDGPDLHIEVELRAKDLRLVHEHAEKAGSDGAGAHQAHANRLESR